MTGVEALVVLGLLAVTVGYVWMALTYEAERPSSQGWDR